MQDSRFTTTLIIIGTATIAVAASVYYLTSTKKKVKNVLSRESFISNRNLSWFQLPNIGLGAGKNRLLFYFVLLCENVIFRSTDGHIFSSAS